MWSEMPEVQSIVHEAEVDEPVVDQVPTIVDELDNVEPIEQTMNEHITIFVMMLLTRRRSGDRWTTVPTMFQSLLAEPEVLSVSNVNGSYKVFPVWWHVDRVLGDLDLLTWIVMIYDNQPDWKHKPAIEAMVEDMGRMTLPQFPNSIDNWRQWQIARPSSFGLTCQYVEGWL